MLKYGLGKRGKFVHLKKEDISFRGEKGRWVESDQKQERPIGGEKRAVPEVTPPQTAHLGTMRFSRKEKRKLDT